MATVGEWLRGAEARLAAAGFASPQLEAQLLAAHVLRVERSWLFAHPEHEFNDLAGENVLQRREGAEPLAYILGWKEFYGRNFGVDKSVLIPRQDTETLVEAAFQLAPPRPNPLAEPFRVLDIGTGSGVIAATLKLERPSWDVTAIDISPEALTTASANARLLKAEVRFVLGDLFEPLLGESFDLIASNPPYIGEGESLDLEVSGFEPTSALYADDDGLAIYKRLAVQAADYLNDEGVIVVEVGYRQADAVEAIFRGEGWSEAQRFTDLAGIDRVLAFRPSFACQTSER